MALYTHAPSRTVTATSEEPAGEPLPILLAFLLALAIALVPVVFTHELPLLDWPNHLARMHVLRDIGDSPLLQQIYAVHWRPIPDLAMDLIVPPLARVMPLETAGKAFIALTFFLMAGGVALVRRQLFGRAGWWSLLAFLFLYDRIFLLGFLNYLFGVGLALTCFALWLALARRSAWLRILLSSLAALALYISHLFAFGVYGLAVAGLELARVARAASAAERRAALTGLPLAAIQAVLPLALFLSQPHDPVAQEIVFGRLPRKADQLFTLFDNYHRPFDIVCFAALLLLFLWACWRRHIRLAPLMAGPLIALGLAYFAMPSHWLTAANLDRRIPIAFTLMLIASTAPLGWSRRAGLLVAAGLSGLFLARIAVIEMQWQDYDRFYATLLPAFQEIQPGARLALAYPAEAASEPPDEPPVAHLAMIAVRWKDAWVPTFFAAPSQQPVQFTHDYGIWAVNAQPQDLWRELVEHQPTAVPGRLAMLKTFDDLLFLDHKPFDFTPPDWLAPILVTPTFKLYRVVKPPGG